MKFTELENLSVEITQLTPHVYGEGLFGASISFKATAPEDAITIDGDDKQPSLWGDDDEVSEITKIMNGNPHDIDDVELFVKIGGHNGGEPILQIAKGHKIKVSSAKPIKGRQIQWGFSISFFNQPGELDAVQQLVKKEGLFLTTQQTA